MDEYEEQIKLQAVGSKYQRSYVHFFKNTLQIVVSLAFLSIFLCHSSGFSLFPHSFNVYFSTLLFSFFTHTLERKYMFLICNGILAFLAKSSVSSGSSPSEFDHGAQISTSSTNLTQTKASVTHEADGDYDHVPRVAEGEEPEDTYRKEAEGEEPEDTYRKEAEGEEPEDTYRKEAEEQGEHESEASVIVEHVEEFKEGESGCLVKQEQQEGVGAVVGANEEVPISTEELNRKIEEFIRKMKEEIRIEAQQQMIAF